MIKKFLRRTNSFLLAAVMTLSMIPAQMASAAEPAEAIGDAALLQQEDSTDALNLGSITVIEGNAPIFPKEAVVSGEEPISVQWGEWDKSKEAGTYSVTGTAGETQVEVAVEVLPCDEAVPDVDATGTSDGDAAAVHSLRGYKGKFVAEYDIVTTTYVTHDRAVIYLPERIMKDGSWQQLDSGNCWDTGARLQFKYNKNNIFYFQTQDGDGKVASNAVYYPTNEELDAAIDSGNVLDNALLFEEGRRYRVRTEMDTASDTEKANYKIYITDPDGIVHEVTKPGGNGFRIYPENGIVCQFAAVRGGYRLENHKISWITGYAAKEVETYLKTPDAEDYAKEETVTTKELPGTITEQPDAEIIKDNQRYILDTEISGWYKNEELVASITANEGETVTYRAYYKPVDKTDLNNKIQNTDFEEEDYTSASWNAFAAARTEAISVNGNGTASQSQVNEAVQKLSEAEEDLVSIKNLKSLIETLKAELSEKADQKDDYSNWAEVESALESAETILEKANATKSEVEDAEESLNITLIAKSEVETAEAKKAMEDAVADAERKIAEIKEADYTPASWTALKDALEACKNLNQETATKADYDAKKEALDRAVNGLAKLADKTALNQAITDANAKKEADYEAAGFKTMQEKLAEANKAAANPNAAQSEVDEAKDALLNAINKLVKKSAGDQPEKPAEVKVTSIKRTASSYKIAAGKKLDLKKVFTALPENADNRNVTYSMDKKYSQYASIKSGVVTVKRKGAGRTIAVKATAADGSGKSATIKIKIMKDAVTKITVKKKALTVKAGKKITIKPTVKTNGKNANKTLTYTSSNEKIATVKNGVVTTKKGKTGKVTITIQSTDGTGKSVKVKVNIKK